MANTAADHGFHPELDEDIARIYRFLEESFGESLDPLDDYIANMMRAIHGVALLVGRKFAGIYQQDQPNLSFEELRPSVILTDINEEARKFCFQRGLSEKSYWVLFQTFYFVKATEAISSRYEAEVDEEALEAWVNTRMAYFLKAKDET